MLERNQKESVVNEITTKLRDYGQFIVADYSGLNVQQITQLRKELIESSGNQCEILKNNLMNLALANVISSEKDRNKLSDYLLGPSMFIFIKEEKMFQVIKLLFSFAKKNENLKIKGGFLVNQVMNLDIIKKLSILPSRDVLLTKLLIVLNTPLTRMLRVLNHPMSQLALALKAIQEKKGA